jgi:hypothetical protein
MRKKKKKKDQIKKVCGIDGGDAYLPETPAPMTMTEEREAESMNGTENGTKRNECVFLRERERERRDVLGLGTSLEKGRRSGSRFL